MGKRMKRIRVFEYTYEDLWNDRGPSKVAVNCDIPDWMYGYSEDAIKDYYIKNCAAERAKCICCNTKKEFDELVEIYKEHFDAEVWEYEQE